ncbi:hypothetical protein [Cereibacter sphaeroides]|jgi:hypothetical protein|uniref:hypothetical protein n=1 Tax=Cereibacter sphaeroides TaxID=1063 RepID=UPI0000664299|nr:hypothetical protein Rsph17029_4094 [Cereibacter sphaeroides ATCC 17029]
MKALVHIGTGKTGSTSIQSYMYENRMRLQAQGIYYPQSPGARNHRRLPAIVQKEGKADNYFRDQRLIDPAARQVARTAWWKDLCDEITAVRQCGRCIISAEHLSQLDMEETQDLHARLTSLFEEVRILVYLRDPVDYAISMYDTALKIGSTAAAPAPPVAGGPTDYARILKRWADAFGQENLTVRLFDRAELTGGDILQDFADAAGINTQDFVTVNIHNPSLGRLGQQLLLRVNKRLPRYRRDGSPNPVRGDIVGLFERFLVGGSRLAPDQKMIAAYNATFASSNEWVRQTFFPDRPTLFRERTAAPAIADMFNEDDLDRLADLISESWRQGREAQMDRKRAERFLPNGQGKSFADRASRRNPK